MRFTVVKPQSLDAEAIRTWRSIQASEATLASPCFSPDFFQLLGSIRENVEVAVAESGGLTAGFFPYERGRGNDCGPAGGGLSDFQGFIGLTQQPLDPQSLLTGCRMRSFRFDHMLASQNHFGEQQTARWESPQINLAEGYKAYLDERKRSGSDQIRSCMNLSRRLEREHGPVTFTAHSVDRAVLSTVLAWKSGQYHATGCADVFASEQNRLLMERLIDLDTPGCKGMLSLLHAGGTLVAGHVGMTSPTVWHYWFPSYDPGFHRYSPGILLLLCMAEHAAANGIHTIDLGAGTSLYKQRLMNQSVTLAAGEIAKPGVVTLSRKLGRAGLAQARKLRHWFRTRN